MKKNNARIKSNITMADKVNAIESIVSSYFTEGKYTPYYAQIAEITAIVTYFMEGMEFGKEESVYNSVISDEEVMNKINLFYGNASNAGKVMAYVRGQVDDKVDFIKQQIIHSHADMDKIIETCNVVIDALDNLAKLNIGQMSKEDMEIGLNIMRQFKDKDFTAENLSEAIKGAVDFDIGKATAGIIDAKNAEIRDLKKYKTLWESRNATNSDKVVAMPTKE